ncbi:hypothetical protein CRENBAI_004955, partial [Crenichthys baileyi]
MELENSAQLKRRIKRRNVVAGVQASTQVSKLVAERKEVSDSSDIESWLLKPERCLTDRLPRAPISIGFFHYFLPKDQSFESGLPQVSEETNTQLEHPFGVKELHTAPEDAGPEGPWHRR